MFIFARHAIVSSAFPHFGEESVLQVQIHLFLKGLAQIGTFKKKVSCYFFKNSFSYSQQFVLTFLTLCKFENHLSSQIKCVYIYNNETVCGVFSLQTLTVICLLISISHLLFYLLLTWFQGWNGSGTIFFGMCNLRCVFCQNWDISQKKNGWELKVSCGVFSARTGTSARRRMAGSSR